MSIRSYKEAKAKRERGGFVAIPNVILESCAYARLSPYAVKLLLDIFSQYKGNNNGDLCAAWKIMRLKGWRSEDTLNKSKKELLQAGFITEMRKGHRPNVCSLYAVTWCKLDPCDKHDFGPSGFVFGEWKKNEPPPKMKARLLTRHGIINPVNTRPVAVEAA